MFEELLLQSLQSLTPDEKEVVRKILESDPKVADEKIGETRGDENNEKGDTIMSNDDNKKSVDTSISVSEKTNTNEVENGQTNKVDETKKVDGATKDTAQTPNGENANEGDNENVDQNDNGENTDTATEQVQETEPTGNGIRIDDLVTKEELTERLSAMEAKFEAVLKENEGLKDKLSDMEDKYENKDFGTLKKQGMPEIDKSANDTFEEYAKQFS